MKRKSSRTYEEKKTEKSHGMKWKKRNKEERLVHQLELQLQAIAARDITHGFLGHFYQ